MNLTLKLRHHFDDRSFCLLLFRRPKIVTTNTKVDRREIGKERKALKAAQLDRAIENELLERLRQVSESEIYNYPEQQYKKILSRVSEKFEGNLPMLSKMPLSEKLSNLCNLHEKSPDEAEDEEEDVDEEAELEEENEDEGEDEEYNVEYVEVRPI